MLGVYRDENDTECRFIYFYHSIRLFCRKVSLKKFFIDGWLTRRNFVMSINILKILNTNELIKDNRKMQ